MVAIPAGTGATNCNDGGGGDGDCHDNAFSYQWCVQLPVPRRSNLVGVNLRLGSSNGGTVFVEKVHVYIDSSRIDQPKYTQKEPSASTGAIELDAPWADTVTHQHGKK